MKTHVVIHHSARPDGLTLDSAGIERYHVETLGWRDIGYHLIVEMFDGRPVAMLGRPLDWAGAHANVADWNRKSVGVCFVGNYSEQEPSIELLSEGARHIAAICKLLAIYPETGNAIVGHRDLKATECPGKHFSIPRLVDLVVDAM